MRRCPACRRNLGTSFIFEMRHITRFLCTKCWATIHLRPIQFVAYTIGGGAFGVGLVLGIAMAGKVRFANLGGAWALVAICAALAGRFLPKLEVEDPAPP